jgi:PAS domain-containing protein
MFGLSLSQMQGRSPLDPRWRTVREDGSDYPGDEHPAMVALRTGVKARDRLGVFNPADGNYRWLDVTAVPDCRPGQHGPWRVYAAFEDVTERRAAEEQLQVAQKMEAMGRLAGGVAHDFNNLIAVITGYADLLGEKFSDEDPRRADVDEIRQAGRRLWVERGRFEGGDALLDSPVGLAGRTVSGTLLAAGRDLPDELLHECRRVQPAEGGRAGVTRLPQLTVGRYLGDSGEEAHAYFAALWALLRPALKGCAAAAPRIWAT